MKKNLFLTFCFSLLPGAGQMYQSYMKRGLSILILFAFSIIIASLFSTPIFAIFSFVIFVYSFFDSFNIRNQFDVENIIQDNYIITNETQVPETLKGLINKKSYLIGIGFILIGIYLLLNNVFSSIAYNENITWLLTIIKYITKYLPTIIISALSIGVGIKILK